jgi:prophage antirepressor-like protein
MVEYRPGETWFVATDVAAALEYRDAPDMTRGLDEDEKGTQIVRTLGGDQKLTVISESGLYVAIMKSRKPEAKKFKKWVTAEVIPSIRKTGGYQLQAAPILSPALRDELSTIVRTLLESSAREMLPKLIHQEMAASLVMPRYGLTAGQVWARYGLPTKGLRGYAGWFGNRLAERQCSMVGSRAEMGGRTSRVFDPDRCAAAMTGELLAECRRYVQQRFGQSELQLVD